MEHLPNASSLAFVEGLYEDYLRDPESVPVGWREYFKGWSDGQPAGAGGSNGHGWRAGPRLKPRSIFNPVGGANGHAALAAEPRPSELRALQHRVDQLIRNYRVRGHMIAAVDPLGLPRQMPPELDPAYYGFTEAEMDLRFTTDAINGRTTWTLREILDRVRNTYCRSIGVQFMHIDSLAVREWLQERMESTENRLNLTRAEQLRILTRLTDAVMFEEFIQKKYIGAKSFSLEGAESLIPLLDLAIEKAGEQGIDEIVFGMAHRGRLNVLANILGKNPQKIFREFEDVDTNLNLGGGDVKYHLGYSSDWVTASGRTVHLSLCFNPSHLEFVNPVAQGRIRAKQDRVGDVERDRGMALLIHGDAAFIGEGVVQESLNLSQLEPYRTGGTLHVIVNNQIGFTTSPEEGRSTAYATDVAKMLQIPIFHVNGEDPEAVAQCVRLAMDFRKAFKRDVVIDMYCYRRRGHNEGDEPSFTQPRLYQAIAKRPTVREGYLEHLLKLEGLTREEADRIEEQRREHLERELAAARSQEYVYKPDLPGGIWNGYGGGPDADAPEVETGVPAERLRSLLERLSQTPEGFHVHRKLERFLAARADMAKGERPLDWSAGEALALATLATEGVRVRLTGQDSERGTFSQRHAVLHDVETGETYEPLSNLAPDQASVEIRNSPLSENGVLGFEYGYSLDTPDGLVMWEAQFGDFANVAQVIIDQFIASAEDKWRRLSGIVMLLPHGFEGQGPEHSSARLERFLTLAAQDNLQIVYPTTPAQYFHVLRRQVVRPWRTPLVVFTPKSLLRHPAAVSPLEEFQTGTFRRVLPDVVDRPADAKVSRILLCSGKVYYDLIHKRDELGRKDVAIVRLEQLYPLQMEPLREALAPYDDQTPALWVQEEPENMGAWRYLKVKFGCRLLDRFPFDGIYRPESASPATGSKAVHELEQERLLSAAFGG